MAFGPLGTISYFSLDTTGRIFEGTYKITGGGGADVYIDSPLSVIASLDADATVIFAVPVPPVIPAGTPKIDLRLYTDDNGSHAAKFTFGDKTTAVGADPSAASFTDSAQTTVSWATQARIEKQVKLTLNSTPVAGDTVWCHIKFQTSGWTLTSIMYAHVHGLIYE